MEGRGRLSGAALSVVSPLSVVERPKPPAELTPEQAAEWKSVVERLPADWFGRETWGLLAQYCRHVVAARRVSELIRTCEGSDRFSVEDYDRLLKMQEREGRALSAMATRMRITQHSTYDKKKKRAMNESGKPWETSEKS